MCVTVALLFVDGWACRANAAGRKKDVRLRTWKDRSGKFDVDAVLVELAVRLKREDGTVVSVPFSELSQPDQQYLRKEMLRLQDQDGELIFREDFLTCKEGDQPAGWGDNVYVRKSARDRRHWLTTSLDGAHAVGANVPFPDAFFLEFDYMVQLGNPGLYKSKTKGSASSNICLQDADGHKYRIEWDIDWKTHMFTLPDGAQARFDAGRTAFEDPADPEDWAHSHFADAFHLGAS